MAHRMLVSFVAFLALGSHQASSLTTSPEETAKQFVTMDAEGSRLTPEGWRLADNLFVQRSEPSHPKVVVVIAGDYAVSKSPEKTKDGVYLMGYEELGTLDTSSLRFTPANNGHMHDFDSYTVVSTDARSTEAGRTAANERQGSSPEWKIDGMQPKIMHLTAAAAIRYVKEMRANITDPAALKSADSTVNRLASYK